ncbi:hypothetical protein Tco_0869951 [Tanacetum coccineum]
MKSGFLLLRESRSALLISDWKPFCHKRKRFQVVIDIIKNSTCFKAFTISADVPEIFMQQFWYTIKKVKYTESYQFLLANKKCTFNVEVFRTILDICPRVEGVDFTGVPDDDTSLTFLIDLGYKGLLNRHTNMFVDHMHQPWRTLEAIINKCLSGKTASNDKLRKSRIDILWGMFNRENVDYPELIWEDVAYQIDHRKEKISRREDYQEYGLPIPIVMLTNAIKQSESYQMFIKYSTGQIRPKKITGKESEPEPEPATKKTFSKRRFKKKVTLSADDNIISDDPDVALELGKSISQTEVEEAEAARQVHATHARIVTESIPKSLKKKSGGKSSKSVVIQDTPSALKSKPATSKSKLKDAPFLTLAEQEATNIMQALKESKKTSKRQPGTGGSNEGTGTIPRVPDESIIVSATSSKGTSIKPGVPDEENDITEKKVILEWGDKQDSEHTDDDHDDVEKDDKDDVKTKSDKDDIKKYKIRVRKDEDEEITNAEVDDSNKGDEEITDAAKADAKKTSEVKDDAKKTELSLSSSSLSVSSGFGDQFLKLSSNSSLVSTVKDTTNTEINSLLEVKIQSKVPHTQPPSMLSVLVSVILEPTVLTPVQESSLIVTATTLPPLSVSTTPPVPQQTTTPIPIQPVTTAAPTIITILSESNALTAVELRVSKFEKDMSEIKTVDHSTEALAILKSQFTSVVDNYLRSKVGDLTKKPTPTVEQESEKSPSDILKIKKEQAEKQKKPQFTIKSTNKAALKEYDLKSALYQSMHTNKSFNRNPANHRLYHALTEALIEDENAMDKGVADTVKDHKRKHDDDDDDDDDDEDPPAGPKQDKNTKRRRTKEYESSKKSSSTKDTPKGKTLTKGSKTGKSTPKKEPVEEPIVEVIMDDAGGDVARDDNPPQDTSELKTRKTLNLDLFKQPPRPPTPDPEWNKRLVVLDQPE